MKEKLILIWCIENQSLILDLKILLLTIKKVFTRDGVNQTGEAIAKRFKASL